MASRPRLTNKTLFVLGAMNMIDCINVNLLTPYVDRMVSDFLGKDSADPQVGHIVGLLIGFYSLCEVCFSPLWGALSDRVGRKPALLIGLGGSVIAPILFGLGKDLTTVFVARGLDGFFCGNTGVTRTYLGEIVDETNEARGFSFLAICFSLGLFIGPILGGELVHPAEWAPGVFGGTVFEEYPYLLPNLTYAIFAAVAWAIGALFLEETLPGKSCNPRCCCSGGADARTLEGPRTLSRQTSGTDPAGAPRVFALSGNDAPAADIPGQREEPPSGWARCYSPLLLQAILAFCVLSGYTSSANQLFILIVSFPRSVDGFAFGPREIGGLQNVAAVALLITNTFVYPRLTARFGYVKCFKAGWAMQMVGQLLFPVYGIFADPEQFGFLRFIPLACMQVVLAVGGGLLFPTSFAFINRAAKEGSMGAVNGWATSSGALCRAFFPPMAAVLLGWGQQLDSQWGRYIAIYVNCIVSTLAMAFALPGMEKVESVSAPQTQRPEPAACVTDVHAEQAAGRQPFLADA